MVDIVSVLIGISLVVGGVIFAASYLGVYVYGQRNVSESAHYVNHRDVETHRLGQVRDEELANTRASVADERPDPHEGE